ncbi:MAG TPA: 3-hydroxybutyryl-CoA dehydrogenase [Gemmatimonadaceae bacterium]|jgi:3-hydroxybutyryl-CoA dehydrogenase|nr:3-hydroxybutyryl-CoA dehydrogenase [Gemmatimonadaceae bacterium]
MAEITAVGILGGGLMGAGIAQVCAQAGYDTVVREVSDALCEKALASIETSFDKAIAKDRATAEDKAAALSRLRFVTSMIDLRDRDLIIEAVVEDRDVKRASFGKLDVLCPPHTIFASNTSSLTITELAGATKRADRFVGLHFFNPVPVMKLVEVVRALHTSEETMETAVGFVRALGKEPIRAKDKSGFIVNLLLVPYMLDAVRALETGFGSMTDIDTGMRLGAGHPMGPFTLLDFVGLDTAYKISEIMFNEYHDSRYAAPPLLKRMVMAGMLGKKSGMGFYNYAENPPTPNDLGL